MDKKKGVMEAIEEAKKRVKYGKTDNINKTTVSYSVFGAFEKCDAAYLDENGDIYIQELDFVDEKLRDKFYGLIAHMKRMNIQCAGNPAYL